MIMKMAVAHGAALAVVVGAWALGAGTADAPQPEKPPPAAVATPEVIQGVAVPASPSVVPAQTVAPKAPPTGGGVPPARELKAPVVKATPKAKAPVPRPVRQQPPAYTERELDGGGTVWCSNGYLQPNGSCTSRPEGYNPPPAPAGNPCAGTATECLNASMPELYNGIPGLMGGR